MRRKNIPQVYLIDDSMNVSFIFVCLSHENLFVSSLCEGSDVL